MHKGVPKHGPGAHPEGSALALDGRTRTSIAKAGSLDSQEHLGSLFWLAHRSSDASEANMVLESCSWEHKVTLEMPPKKKKHVVEWEPGDLPSIPLLLNKRAVKQHQRLVVY